MEKLYPLKFKAIYKEKIWGGKKLKYKFSRNIPSNKTGESWEITDNNSGISVVKNGKFAGKKINDLLKKYNKNILGSYHQNKKSFPLLIKFIDANQKLSVQVHPPDKFAKKHNKENGKTEMWYILAAEPGSKLVYGIDTKTSTEKLKKATEKGKLTPYLKEIEVKTGDFFFIPGGTVHAIEEGILLAEIQQNSDTTYRLYDWDRKDHNGKSRPLHIDKAFKVINSLQNKNINPEKWENISYENNNYKLKLLTASPYFTFEHITLKNKFTFNPASKRFYIIINLKNTINLSTDQKKYKLKPGETMLIPAALNRITIKGKGEFLRTYIHKDFKEIKSYIQKLNFSEDEIYKVPGINLFDKVNS